jgi:tRNA modification GTPase
MFGLMEERFFGPEDPIVALATPWGESALAVIRLSGRGSLQLLASVFKPGGRSSAEGARSELAAAQSGHRLRHGYIEGPGISQDEPREAVDEVLVAVYRAPHSYTGEDGAEVSCHGSPLIVRRLLEVLRQAGFRLAGPGEFTLRAFLNRKLDLTQAEAVNELIRARTDRARALALHRLEGSIEGRIRDINGALVSLLAALEVQIDYPEEEVSGAVVDPEGALRLQRELEGLLSTYQIGRIYQEGVSAVLAGRTNSGKSTLFNLLLREERAIVSEVHGTTRDYLEASLDIEGIPVRLYDTAGYRDSGDQLELEGMRRTDTIVQNARIVLYLVDAQSGPSPLDERFLSGGDARVIAVWSKADLAAAATCPPGFMPVSARTGEGIGELIRAIAVRVLEGTAPADAGEPVIDSLRQKQLLERAAGALQEFREALGRGLPLDLLAVDLREAVEALGEITGEVTSQEVLNSIFSRFCVGK